MCIQCLNQVQNTVFGPHPPRLALLSRITPPQVVWDSGCLSVTTPSPSSSRLIPAALTAMFSSGQEVRQGERRPGSDASCSPVKDGLSGSRGRAQMPTGMRKQWRAAPGCLGCRSCRRSGDVTGCCLSACWCFLYLFIRPMWMDVWLNETRAGSRCLPQVGQGHPLRLEISL